MSNEPKAGMSIDPELLAAYIDKRLSPEQRAAVEAQLAGDPDSYAVLVETLKAQEALDAPVPAPAPARRTWVIAASVLAAAAAIALVVWTQPELLRRLRGEHVDPQLERLVAAVGDERYFDARLTGGFHYGPLKSATRGTSEAAKANLALLAAAGELQQRAQSTPTGGNLHAWGVAQVHLGSLDDAIVTLTKTLDLLPDDATVRSDLSAAHLARARTQSRSEDWPLALALADRALQKDARMKEALYNRAVALEGLALNREAVIAWNAYLAEETDAAWRNDAQQRIARLTAKSANDEEPDPPDHAIAALAATNAQRARELFESKLLAAWAAAIVQHDAVAAQQALVVAEDVAIALHKRGHAGPAAAVEEIKATTDVQKLRTLADGYRFYARALDEFDGDRVAASGPLFTEARKRLEASQSPYRLWCAFNEATVQYFNGQLAPAAAATRRLLDDPRVAAIPELQARVLWGAGLFALVQGDLQSSLNAYRQSAALYSSLGETENETFLNTLTAEAFDFSGDSKTAWTYRLRALTNRSPSHNVRRPHTTLVNAAVAAMRQGLPEVAISLTDEAAALVRGRQQPRLELESVLYRGRAHALAGHVSETERDLADAESRLDAMPGPLKTRYASEIQLTRSYLPHADVQALTESSERFLKETGTNVRVPQLQLAIARAKAKAGDAAGAQTVLAEAIDQVTISSSGLAEAQRWSYADHSWPLFRDAAILRLERDGNVASAIDIAERGRLSRAPASTAAAVAQELGPHDAVVRFLAGDDRLHAIVIRDGGFTDIAINSGADDVERLAQQFKDALARNDPEVPRVLSDVGRALVDPWINQVPEGDVITVIPDGPLHFISLAPVRLADGRYLVQRNPLRTAPDLSRVPRRAASVGGTALAIGVAAFDNEGLPKLPAAAAEAAAIGRLYPGARVLTNGEATVDSVLKESPRAAVLHFATHGYANPEYPNLSWIALRADAGHAQGLLFSHQIRTAHLESVDVVFLSTCDGSQGQLSRAEGEASLARAFLDAGAGAVVASSWEVDDVSALEFSTEFHTNYRRLHDPVLALREAQLSALTATGLSPSSAPTWGAFRVYSRLGHTAQESNR